MRVSTGAMSITPMACGKVARPDSRGLSPRSSCRKRGSTKSVAEKPMKAMLCVRLASANMRLRKRRTSMSGSARTRSTAAKAASSRRPPPPKPSTRASPKPRPPASASP